MRCIVAFLIALGLQANTAAAQTRVVVVPAGDQVVVPARGGALPAATRRRAPRARRPPPPLEDAEGFGSGLALPLLSLLPLAAAVALSASLPGASGGTSSPARTR